MLNFLKVLQISNLIEKSPKRKLFALHIKKNMDRYNFLAVFFITCVVFIFLNIAIIIFEDRYLEFERHWKFKFMYFSECDYWKIFARFFIFISFIIFLVYILFKMKNSLDQIAIDFKKNILDIILIKRILLLMIGVLVMVLIVWLFANFYNNICKKYLLCLSTNKPHALVKKKYNVFILDIRIVCDILGFICLHSFIILVVTLISKYTIFKILYLLDYLFAIKNHLMIQFCLFIIIPLLFSFYFALLWHIIITTSPDYWIEEKFKLKYLNFNYYLVLFPMHEHLYLTSVFMLIFLIYVLIMAFLISINNMPDSKLISNNIQDLKFINSKDQHKTQK